MVEVHTPVEGSTGNCGIYVGTKQARFTVLVPVLAIVEVAVEIEAQRVPRLSAKFWPNAFKRALASLQRCAFLDCANWRAGLIAIKTIPASKAIIPITTRISISVNPR